MFKKIISKKKLKNRMRKNELLNIQNNSDQIKSIDINSQKSTMHGIKTPDVRIPCLDPKSQWIADLEKIFQKAMIEEKLNIALKAKELLAKHYGWLERGVASTPNTIKTIDQWTLQEINQFILQLDTHHTVKDAAIDTFKKDEN